MIIDLNIKSINLKKKKHRQIFSQYCKQIFLREHEETNGHKRKKNDKLDFIEM